MAYRYPHSLNELIRYLTKLPGIGPKSAQRLAFFLLNTAEEDAVGLAGAIVTARRNLHHCSRCGNFTDGDICDICADERRDAGLICVVEQTRDIAALERAACFNGHYHVLGGAISPLDGVGPEQLKLQALFSRLQEGKVREVVLATNPTVEGEATALYLAKKIRPLGVMVSRLAHGLPVGGDLEYADEATLSLALAGRKEIY
jgi:recombination protein RecR